MKFGYIILTAETHKHTGYAHVVVYVILMWTTLFHESMLRICMSLRNCKSTFCLLQNDAVDVIVGDMMTSLHQIEVNFFPGFIIHSYNRKFCFSH